MLALLCCEAKTEGKVKVDGQNLLVEVLSDGVDLVVPWNTGRMQVSDVFIFDCVVNKELGATIGIALDPWSTGVQVTAIRSGSSAEAYNLQAREEHEIRPDDFVLAVNGGRNVVPLLEDCKLDSSVELRICRPARLAIRLAKGPHQQWGLSMGIHTKSRCMMVKDLLGGAIQEYNQQAEGPARLRAGDFVQMVNGIAGSASDIAEEFRTAVVAELIVLRLSNPWKEAEPRADSTPPTIPGESDTSSSRLGREGSTLRLLEADRPGESEDTWSGRLGRDGGALRIEAGSSEEPLDAVSRL